MIHQILINDSNNIPKKLPKYHLECVKSIKEIYYEEEYKLYSGKEIEEIIKNNFDPKVYTSYKMLKPYACKCDLARACILYLYGGLYIDLNIKLINPLPLEKGLSFFAFRDLPQVSSRCWAVQNGIMYSKPGCPVMRRHIEIVVENCKNMYYGNHCVDCSATTVLGQSIMTSMLDWNLISTRGQLTTFNYEGQNRLCFVSDGGELIALRKPSGGGDIESMGFEGTNNYVKMWEELNVYDDSYLKYFL